MSEDIRPLGLTIGDATVPVSGWRWGVPGTMVVHFPKLKYGDPARNMLINIKRGSFTVRTSTATERLDGLICTKMQMTEEDTSMIFSYTSRIASKVIEI